MSYEIEVTRPFDRCIKDLKKKYPNVKGDLAKVFPRLRQDPEVGDSVPGFEDRVWKLRVASTDIRKGKRGGYRLIYYWRRNNPKLYLVLVYAKVKKEDVTKKELERLLREILEPNVNQEKHDVKR